MRPPALTHPSAAVFLGDCLDVLAEMPDDSVDAIVCDPPYGLGFMGKAWDDLPPGLPWAEECLRVLKPGGHLLAFGGTRTWHRLAVAVEDAGFEVRDSIAWLYGSGFPKSLDVSKAIDKVRDEDAEPRREVCRQLRAALQSSGNTRTEIDRHFGTANVSQYWFSPDRNPQVPPVDKWPWVRDFLGVGPTLDAEVWRLNGRKGTPGEAWDQREVVGQGSSGIGTAFGDGEWAQGKAEVFDITAPATPAAQTWHGWGTALKPAFEPIVVARKPLIGTVAANVLAHGTGALNVDGCRVNPGTPVSGGGNGKANHGGRFGGDGGTSGERPKVEPHTAGRWPANVLLDGDAAAELDGQSGTLPGRGNVNPTRRSADAGRTAYGTFQGQGTVEVDTAYNAEGGASRFFPTFRYQAKAPTRERPTVVAEDGTKTAHPTVKPLALMRWLVRLVTPPGGTVLDTFAGSGATIEAAIEEGFYALGIEREETYLPLIQVRLDRVVVPEVPA